VDTHTCIHRFSGQNLGQPDATLILRDQSSLPHTSCLDRLKLLSHLLTLTAMTVTLGVLKYKFLQARCHSCQLTNKPYCYTVIFVNNYPGSKFVGRQSRPVTSEVGRSDTVNLSRYRQRHLNERRQPMTDVDDVEPDSDSDVIPPSPVNHR